MKTLGPLALFMALALPTALATACHDDDDDGAGENTGASCSTPDDCYPDVAEGALVGDPVCMDVGDSGYCTHTCTDDGDCCAADGECSTGLTQLCAPFTSDPATYCFLSCEELPEGYTDENTYCQDYAHPDFICRSTGGGSDNKKVCVPEG
jgi:hypothetical protein